MIVQLISIIVISCEFLLINCQLNLYDRDRSLDFDCLYYHIENEKLAYQQLSNVVDELIPYCFRSNSTRFSDYSNISEEKLTFKQLSLSNITSEQLLTWSAPIDLVEDYQFYLTTLNKSLSNELFYNCTRPWFGSRCQYSFEFDDRMSINEIVSSEFSRKFSYIDSAEKSIQLPCYVHLDCDRGEPNLCLDWREICDGRIDCLNNGIDEQNCFEIELNECSEDEYRCHNGLCISDEFWENGVNEAECLDRSDELPNVSYLTECYRDPRFHCEEHTCRSNWHEFSCGDGECVQKFNQCHNGRHIQLIESISSQGNLTEKCWLAMLCLTKLDRQIQCENLLEYLQTCESIFEFPIGPIHLGHIRFLYEKPYFKLKNNNQTKFLYPDYICFDDDRCDCINPTYFYRNLTCIHSKQIDFQSEITGYPWIDLIFELNYHFSSCLIQQSMNIELNNQSTMYFCENSSKIISKHRIHDQQRDCCFNDDENSSLSCSINDKYRINCPNEDLCLSSLQSIEDCPDYEAYNDQQISFESFCNGFEEYLFEDADNGQIQTDETNCDYWPCNNLYSRCDGHWLCPQGEDEYECDDIGCPFGTHPCLSFVNYSLSCLPSERINDGIIDCLGSSDEMNYCREFYPSKSDYERFRCLNSDLCLSIHDLCNDISSCPQSDDELFCQENNFICQTNSNSTIENILCQLSEFKRKRILHFSIQTSISYPDASSTSQLMIPWTPPSSNTRIPTAIESRKLFFSRSPLDCYRGLTVRIRSSNENDETYGCMCPPSYYGEHCQYQNQRISLTINLIRLTQSEIYTILILLIDENRQVESYEQIDYTSSQSCSIKFNRYLLYSTRPKNPSKNYSIHIDIYEKRTLTYRASWLIEIPFVFLPVNRLSIRLEIPSNSLSISSKCSFDCQHGECIQYQNRNSWFCRCSAGWSGVRCEQQIRCDQCSLDSLCVGSIDNRSICICPLTKFGRRCLLSSSCELNSCENNGQCIPTDLSRPSSEYICICSEEFFGPKCQFRKSKIDIIFENVNMPSYVIAFFLTISNESQPSSTILIEKLTLFQRMITFRLSIPYHMLILKSNEKYYLIVVQQMPSIDILTSLNPTRECLPIDLIFNSTLMKLSRFERIKYYHLVCQMNYQLNCFLDESYLCLCTEHHHANCMLFEREKNLDCSSTNYCRNSGQCLQDHPACPSSIICVCQQCFFGSQCQFYAKGFGLTLDEILGYEIKHNSFLWEQTLPVKISAILTMFMFVIGILNGIFSILTFNNKTAQEVGCGLYLLSSSVTSLLIVITFTCKFWFLFFSFTDFFGRNFVLYFNCMFIEPLLKILLYIDNWLNGCIAVERAIAVFRGIHFNKKQSKSAAKRVILLIICVNVVLLIPQLSYIHLFNDEKEKRTWCVVIYSSILHIYNTFLLFFHFLIPFLINMFSAIFIIILTARQRTTTQTNQLYLKQFKNKLNQHKHLLISPIILILLSLPRLIISFKLDCKKSSKHFWLYLIGYFVSFMPSVFVFVVFVLPSTIFKKSFKQAILRGRHHTPLFKIIFYSK